MIIVILLLPDDKKARAKEDRYTTAPPAVRLPGRGRYAVRLYETNARRPAINTMGLFKRAVCGINNIAAYRSSVVGTHEHGKTAHRRSARGDGIGVPATGRREEGGGKKKKKYSHKERKNIILQLTIKRRQLKNVIFINVSAEHMSR